MVFPKKVLIIALCVIIVAVLVYFFVFRGKSEKSAEESAEASAEGRAIEEASLPVKVDVARIGDLIITLKSPGEAVTNMEIDIKAEVSGVIKNLNLEESKHVKKGELLVELVDEEYRLKYENAAANRLKFLSDYLVEKRYAEQEASTSADMEKIQKAKDDYDNARKRYSEGRPKSLSRKPSSSSRKQRFAPRFPELSMIFKFRPRSMSLQVKSCSRWSTSTGFKSRRECWRVK